MEKEGKNGRFLLSMEKEGKNGRFLLSDLKVLLWALIYLF